MVDFTLIGTVFLHNRPWKKGSEEALQAAGFSDEEKPHQVQCGAIAWPREAPGVDATDAAIEAAAGAKVDLADVLAFIGEDRRVGKPDVDRFVQAQKAAGSSGDLEGNPAE